SGPRVPLRAPRAAPRGGARARDRHAARGDPRRYARAHVPCVGAGAAAPRRRAYLLARHPALNSAHSPGERMDASTAAVSYREALSVWFKVGCLGFGGPAGQIALMHRIL